MDRAAFIARVKQLAPFESDREVEAAVRATLEALGALLVTDERRLVLDALPQSLRDVLRVDADAGDPNLDLDGFYDRVAQHEGIRQGYAREHAQVVCEALTETLSDDSVHLLRRHLPEHADLFTTRERPQEPERVERSGHVVPLDRSLAGGRPGSRHPVSESHPDRAHAHSVASSDDPHADTRLSSSQGLTQEREHETLADGKPPGTK